MGRLDLSAALHANRFQRTMNSALEFDVSYSCYARESFVKSIFSMTLARNRPRARPSAHGSAGPIKKGRVETKRRHEPLSCV